MGAIAEAMVNFARPLIDATDGSEEQLNRAMMLSQLCWNLSLMPEDRREESLANMQPSLHMDDTEFEDFRQTVVLPMIRRHEEMFPRLHGRQMESLGLFESDFDQDPKPVPRILPPKTPVRGKYPGTGRYDPCPCGSGEKYKFCCERS